MAPYGFGEKAENEDDDYIIFYNRRQGEYLMFIHVSTRAASTITTAVFDHLTLRCGSQRQQQTSQEITVQFIADDRREHDLKIDCY